MTENKEIGTTEIEKDKKPSHIVYLVKNHGEKAVFQKVGALWPHKDGKGFSQSLEFFDWDIRLLKIGVY